MYGEEKSTQYIRYQSTHSHPSKGKSRTKPGACVCLGFENEFMQYGHGQIDDLNINYNYKSLMHYGSKAFTKSPNLDTLTAIGIPGNIELGNDKMSALDVIELDALYRCKCE